MGTRARVLPFWRYRDGSGAAGRGRAGLRARGGPNSVTRVPWLMCMPFGSARGGLAEFLGQIAGSRSRIFYYSSSPSTMFPFALGSSSRV